MSRWRGKVDQLVVDVEVPANATLAETLRIAGRVECKVACAEGNCGACSVIVDGEVRLGCVTPAFRCQDASVKTAASFADGPIAAQLVSCGGLQCGFCTPGIVVALHALAEAPNPPASIEQLRAALDANLCRCTGYAQLLEGGLAGIKELVNGRLS